MKNKPLIFTFLLAVLFSFYTEATIYTTQGNLILPLRTGKELNAKRLELIQNAQYFIYIKTFIINRDPTEAPVYEALCEKARSGIDVRILVDDIGRRQGGNPIKMRKGDYSISWFKSCGVRFERYSKLSWGLLTFALYHQHDKLLVTEDGAIMGGTNFSRDYSLHGQLEPPWYDFDVVIQGPAVCSLQVIFVTSWTRAYEREKMRLWMTQGKADKISKQFGMDGLNEHCSVSDDMNIGTTDLNIIFNDPLFSKEQPFVDYIVESTQNVMDSPANRVINLYAPYFVPNKKVVEKLVEASRAGVQINIITNSETSIDREAFVAYVGMLYKVRSLLESGVKIFLWNPSLLGTSGLSKNNIFHKKGGCFGQLNCFVGSHNLDVRGDKFSSELIAVLTDKKLLKEQDETYTDDLRYTVPLTIESRRELLKSTKITQKILAKISSWTL
jgi:cardiolipin synthase